MRSITVSLTDEQYSVIEDSSGDEKQYSSKSDAVRSLLNKGLEYDDLVDELQSKEADIEGLERRNEELNKRLAEFNDIRDENQRLQNEKRALIQQRQENQELAEYVEQERSLQQEARQRQMEKESAPVWKRLEWFIFGR